MREQDQFISYLTQARKQLQSLVPQSLEPKNSDKQTSLSTKKAVNETNVQTKSSPANIPEVIDWLDRLIANAPKPTPLLTTQILDQPKR